VQSILTTSTGPAIPLITNVDAQLTPIVEAGDRLSGAVVPR
jgi:hypothetical protein